MANTSPPYKPLGFQPTQYLSGTPWNGQFTAYPIAPLYATSLFTGDPVRIDATTGTVITANGVDANPALLGIFVGCDYVDAVTKRQTFSPYWPASTATVANTVINARIVDDPNVMFDVVVNPLDTGGAGQGNMLHNYDFSGGTGNTLNGLSGASLNLTSTSNTAGFKAVRFSEVIGNLPGPTNATANRVLVLINNHYYKRATDSAAN